jgi:hypothetical protein
MKTSSAPARQRERAGTILQHRNNKWRALDWERNNGANNRAFLQGGKLQIAELLPRLVYLANICTGVYLPNSRLVSVVAFRLLLCCRLFRDTVSAADAAQVRMSLKGNVL